MLPFSSLHFGSLLLFLSYWLPLDGGTVDILCRWCHSCGPRLSSVSLWKESSHRPMPNIFLTLPTTPEVGQTHQESEISQWTQLQKDDNTIKMTGEQHEWWYFLTSKDYPRQQHRLWRSTTVKEPHTTIKRLLVTQKNKMEPQKMWEGMYYIACKK